MAIDYGRKQIGIAVTNTQRINANGLKTVGPHEIFQFLQQYLATEKVDIFVVGHPKQMNNEESENMTYIKPFLTALKRKFPNIPIEMYDERFTSVLAHRALIEGGARRNTRQDKALIDTMSATIILTSYLSSQQYTNSCNHQV